MFALHQASPFVLYPLSTEKKQVLYPQLLLKINLIVASIYDAYSQKLERLLETNAAVINISSRQRMLSQRVAFFCMRLIVTPPQDQETIKTQLTEVLDLMENSHHGLLYGDKSLKLSGQHSSEIHRIYYFPPYNLDQQVQQFIDAGRRLIATDSETLTIDNPHLKRILTAASQRLLLTLGAAVTQYQKEKEHLDLAIDIYQVQLYQASLDDQAIAETRAQELKQTLKKLQKTQLQLVQSEKLSTLGHLSAGLAHEINNPLNFIYGNLTHAQKHVEDLMAFLEVVDELPTTSDLDDAREELDIEYLREDLPKIMESMLYGAERIRNLVIDLQKFSRQDPLQKEALDIHEALDGSLKLLKHRIYAKKTIEIVKDYAVIPEISCHISQVNQVFLNILNNAIDAVEGIAEDGEIIISSQLVKSRTKEPFVRVCISDNGAGITPEVHRHLYEPFYTTKIRGHGTGLGLSISRQIVVDSHNGALRCFSQPGAGARFVIDLPVQ